MGKHSLPPPETRVVRTYDEADSRWPGRLLVLGVILVALAGMVAAGLILGRLLAPTAVWSP